MTKERLKEYRDLLLEYTQLESELTEHLESSLIGGAALDGLPKSDKLADLTAELATKSIELYAALVAKKLEVMRLRLEIEECIEGLEVRERTLMRARYIEGKEWEEVCVEIKYSWAQTHRLHSKILVQIKDDTP